MKIKVINIILNTANINIEKIIDEIIIFLIMEITKYIIIIQIAKKNIILIRIVQNLNQLHLVLLIQINLPCCTLMP